MYVCQTVTGNELQVRAKLMGNAVGTFHKIGPEDSFKPVVWICRLPSQSSCA